MKTATVIDQPTLPPVTDEMQRAADNVGNVALVIPESRGATMFERLAADPNVPVDKLERLIAMQERIEANNARASFNASFAEMQGEIPVVIERKKMDKGTYAPQEDIVEVVRPILQRHGFSLSFRTEWPDSKTVKVIGILTHREGHDRQSEFLSSADNSGSKNAIQGLGSAVTYGRRYTTTDLLNITTRGADDDGKAAGRPEAPVAPAGFDSWWDDIQAVADEGFGPFSAAWNNSKETFRAYAMGTAKDILTKLKAKAKAVDAAKAQS